LGDDVKNPLHAKISNHRGAATDDAPSPIRVLLVGLPPAIRFALEHADEIAVVGNVASAEDMFGDPRRRPVDVVVLDPHQAGVPAENVVEQVAAQAKVLVLSEVGDVTAMRRAFCAGAQGYLASADQDQVARGVRVVATGGMVIGKSIAPRFAALLCSGSAPYPFPQLTAREQDVLERIAAGKSNHAIARELTLAPKTISNRVSAVFAKLGVAHRSQAIVLARDAGLGRS
jgi:DNA-binding NarL/FixJ family response regulator